MPNITNNVLFKTFILIICLGLIYGLFYTIKNLFIGYCGKHKNTIMLERFTLTPPADPSVAFIKIKTQYDNLIANFDKLEKNIEKAGSDIGDMDYKFNDLNRDICSNLKRVDDGIKGVYCARIPKDEIRLTQKEQEKRASERKANSNIYLGMMKSAYRESTNKDVMECFVNPQNLPSGTGATGTPGTGAPGTPGTGGTGAPGTGATGTDPAIPPPPPENIITVDEYIAIEKIKNSLGNKIFEINSALVILKNSYNKLKGKMTNSRIATYNATIDYNNAHMKKLKEAIININEGFTNPRSNRNPRSKSDPKTKSKVKESPKVQLKEENIYKSMNTEYTTINKDVSLMKKVLADITTLVTKQTPDIKKIEDTIPKPVAKPPATGAASGAAAVQPNTSQSSSKK